MLFQLQSLYVATTIMQSLRACGASPVGGAGGIGGGHLRSKRAPITCLPIDPRFEISFRDCIGALNMMGQDVRNLNQILSFGIGPGVDVSIDSRDPMEWEYGTCAIELQAQGDVPQLSTWHDLRVAGSEIAHSCSLRHREGFKYIDRLGIDSSPAAREDGPNLQLWVGPRNVPDDMVDKFLHYLSEQGSCSVNQRENSKYTEITSQMVDSIATASSRFGPRRSLLNYTDIESLLNHTGFGSLLNHTEIVCGGANLTAALNSTANGGP